VQAVGSCASTTTRRRSNERSGADVVARELVVKRYYSDEFLAQLQTKYATVSNKTDELLIAFMRQQFKNEQAREYARHGFQRRLGTLRHCIQGVFRVIPPETAKVPLKPVLYDAQIYLQSFIANVYGCTDNLAWVWAYEQELGLDRSQVGLRQKHSKLRASFSPKFQAYLVGMNRWFDYVTEYRDALGHRIPLYIPPGGVPKENLDAFKDLDARMVAALNAFNPNEYDRLSEEQSKLLIFQPLIIHSYKEATGLPRFHAQLLADFLTVEEIAYKILNELKVAKQA
jgi:hypothetical protein